MNDSGTERNRDRKTERTRQTIDKYAPWFFRFIGMIPVGGYAYEKMSSVKPLDSTGNIAYGFLGFILLLGELSAVAGVLLGLFLFIRTRGAFIFLWPAMDEKRNLRHFFNFFYPLALIPVIELILKIFN
jgi:hypothetical protein